MHFLTFIFKNTIRRPLRSALTIVAIAVGIGAVVALVGIAGGFERSFFDLYKGVGVDLVVVRAGAKQRLNSAVDEGIGAQIRSIPGVKDVIPGLADVLSFEEQGMYGVLVQGWIPESTVFKHITTLSGRSLKTDDERAVLVGHVLAKNLDKTVGDTIDLTDGEPFEVVGIYKSSNIFEDGAIVVPLKQLQRVMDRPGQVTGFSIQVNNHQDPAAIEQVRKGVESLGGGLTAMTTEDHVKSISELQLVKAMAWLTSAVALVIGIFGIMNTMIMSVHERTKEIGILRALGWRKKRIVWMVLLESVVMSLVGAFVGSVGAFLLVRLLTKVPTVSGVIDGRIELHNILNGFLIAVIVGLIGGLVPAIRATRLLPTEALHYE